MVEVQQHARALERGFGQVRQYAGGSNRAGNGARRGHVEFDGIRRPDLHHQVDIPHVHPPLRSACQQLLRVLPDKLHGRAVDDGIQRALRRHGGLCVGWLLCFAMIVPRLNGCGRLGRVPLTPGCAASSVRLADIERGFRVLKSDLDIAPVFHRLPDRIRAHALICFLALVLYRVMRMRLKAHSSVHSPKTTLELLRRLQKHRVQLGEQRLTGIGKTSSQQLELFEAPGINQPA